MQNASDQIRLLIDYHIRDRMVVEVATAVSRYSLLAIFTFIFTDTVHTLEYLTQTHALQLKLYAFI